MIKYTVRSNKEYASGQAVSVESQSDSPGLDDAIETHLGIIRSFDTEEEKKNELKTGSLSN